MAGEICPAHERAPQGANEPARGVWGWAAALAFLVSMGFSWGMQPVRTLPEIGGAGTGRPDLLAAVSRRPPLSFGFRNALADFAWLQAVQVSGTLKMTRGDYDRLYELLNVVANLDPKFEIPYLLGGLVLGESPDHAQEALRILERGKENHPADWRFPFYIGYTHYFSIGNPEAGGEAMGEASRLHGSPAYLPGLATRMLSEARVPEAALALLAAIARQESDPARRSVLERRMREVAVERDLQLIEKAVEIYRAKKGVVPGELGDLVREGILPAIPNEPHGGKYLLEEGGKVRSDRNEKRLRVFRTQ